MTEEENLGFGWGCGWGGGWCGVDGRGGRKKRRAMRGRMKMQLLEKRIKWGRESRLVVNIPRVERKRQKPDHSNR
jgi:hypothetical protein